MTSKTNPLIIALDVDTREQAMTLVHELGDAVVIYKVGSQLFTACGPDIVREISALGKRIFLDLKFHDIPNTVASAVGSAVALNVFMLTVHTMGGTNMLQAAVKAAREKAGALNVPAPKIIGVTVLTSDAPTANVADIVLQRARLAQEAGLDGIVASPQESQMIRRELGKDLIIVTPGIRPKDASRDDQKRVATPGAAIRSGSNYLVVGRPVVQAASPRQAAQKILDEINGG